MKSCIYLTVALPLVLFTCVIAQTADTLPTCPSNYVAKARGTCKGQKATLAPSRAADCDERNANGRCTTYSCGATETLRNKLCLGPCPGTLTLVSKKCRELGSSPLAPTCGAGLFQINGICYTTAEKPANGQGSISACPVNYVLKVRFKCVRVKTTAAPETELYASGECADGTVKRGKACYGPCPNGLTLVNRKCKNTGVRKVPAVCPTGTTLVNGVCTA